MKGRSGILKKFRGRCAGLEAQGGGASRPPRGGFVGGAVFSNSRAKAGRCPRMGEKGTGLSRRHGATEKIRCSHGSPLLCKGKRGSPKGPANDANPREWKTRVGSDRRADPKFRRAAPPGGKKDSHRDAESGGRKPESGGVLKKFRGRCDVARLKAVGSRSGFRYGGVSAGRPRSLKGEPSK